MANIKNIENKIKQTKKEKTYVLSTRISREHSYAMELLSQLQNISSSNILKYIIEDYIESMMRDMVKVPIKDALHLLSLIKKTKDSKIIVSKDSTKFDFKMNHILSILKDMGLEKVHLSYLFKDEFQIQERLFSNSNLLSQFKYINKYYSDIIKDWEKENKDLFEDNVNFDYTKFNEHNQKIDEDYSIYHRYWYHIDNQLDCSSELLVKYNKLEKNFIDKLNLDLRPFIKDNQENRIYSDTEVIAFWRNSKQRQRNSIELTEEITIQKIIDILTLREVNKEKQKSLNKDIAELYGEYFSPFMEIDIRKNPFKLDSKGKQIYSEELIIKYWKNHVMDIDFFKNKEITLELIEQFLVYKSLNFLNGNQTMSKSVFKLS